MRPYIYCIVLLLVCSCKDKPGQNNSTKSKINTETADNYLGTWIGPNFNPMVEISKAGNEYNAKIVNNPDAPYGMIYALDFRSNKMVALGDKKDFAKSFPPIFQLFNKTKLIFKSGLGTLTLESGNDIKLPDVPFKSPGAF